MISIFSPQFHESVLSVSVSKSNVVATSQIGQELIYINYLFKIKIAKHILQLGVVFVSNFFHFNLFYLKLNPLNKFLLKKFMKLVFTCN